MIPLDWYADLHGTNLFPCHKRVLNDPRSKTPLESGFYNRKHSPTSLESYQDEGHSVGWSPGSCYFAMDVDAPTAQRPDKLGLESLERLIADTGLDLELVPCVKSPSGGLHYYFRKPPQMKIRKVLKDYPGIEFITGNNYVLIAGSPHWQGGNYAFSPDTELLGLTPEDAPAGLLDKLEKVTKPNEASQMSCEELDLLLEHIDQDLHSTYDDWLQIAMASHSATGGAGLAEFTSWSAGGAKFTSECRIKEQWDSFDANEEGGITVATLLHIVKEDMDLMTAEDAEKAAFDLARVKASLAFSDADWGDEWDADPEAPGLPAEAAGKAETKKPERIDIRTRAHERKPTVMPVLRNLPDVLRQSGAYVSDCKLVELRHSADPDCPCIKFAEIPESKLAVLLSERFRFFRSSTNNEGLTEFVRCDVPCWLPKTIREHGVYPGCDEVRAVTQTPQMLLGGRLITEPGLDRETGIYLDPEPGFTMPAIPYRPTRGECEQAMSKVRELVQDFPFEDPSHWAAWLSLAITILVRRAIDGPCPLFLTNGNRSGIGKSLLVQNASLIATGEECTGSYPVTDEECRKRISTAIELKKPVELFDNVPNDGSFGHPSLDAMLTSRNWLDRKLGHSEQIGGRVLTVFAATGINVPLDPSSDIQRRLVAICLDHASETDPTTRADFAIGGDDALKRLIRRDRGKYVGALLTILRGYAVSDETVPLPPFGSYPEWSKVVREPVAWITGHDPCDGIRNTAAAVSQDASGDDKAIVLEAFDEAIQFVARLPVKDRPDGLPVQWTPGGGLTAGELLWLSSEHGDRLPAVRAAMEGPLSADGRRTVRGLGRAIAQRARVVIGGKRLMQRGRRRPWVIEVVN